MASATQYVLFEDVVRVLLRKGISLNFLHSDRWCLTRGTTRVGGPQAYVRRHQIDDVCRAAATGDDAARAVVAAQDNELAEALWPTVQPEVGRVSRELKRRNPAIARQLQERAAQAAALDPNPPAA